MRGITRICGVAAIAVFAAFGTLERSVACPFCSAPSQTLAEQVAQADGVCLVEWVSGRPAKETDPGASTYEVIQAVKSPKDSVKKGDQIHLARYRAGKKGDLFLLMGTRSGVGDAVDWGSPTEITEPAFNYVTQAPSPEVPTARRLKYFIKFLEYPDTLISNDAYSELANAPFKDIAVVAPLMSREKIHKWISSPDTPQTRLGLYGMLLGLRGNAQDAGMLAETISQKTDNFRIGIDGMIAGYLLLTGTNGLEKIEDWKFKDHKVPFSETYAAMMGLRFMWQYAGGKIPNSRLMASMRLLLDRPELADLVIADLSRWNDWSVQDRLMSIYGKGEYNIPSIKRAIIRYMLASTQAAAQPQTGAPGQSGTSAQAQASVPAPASISGEPTPAEYAERGKKFVEQLRKRDPRTVREAERFFFVK